MKKNCKAMKAIKQDGDKELRNAGLVYLYYDEDCTPSELAQFCSLARTTIATYVKKFKNLLEWAREQFTTACRKFNRKISEKTRFWVYIDKVTLDSGETWCKIGQTTNTPEARAKQIKNKGWKVNGETIKPQSVEVQWLGECKDETTMEIMENILRIAMIKLNPSKFQKNDRLLAWEDDYPEKIYKNLQVKIEGQKCLTTMGYILGF